MDEIRIIGLGVVPEGSKKSVALDEAELVAGCGMVGDKHYGDDVRQVCILLKSSADWRDAQPPERSGLCFPRFKENILLDGLIPGGLEPGDRITLGEAELIIDSYKNCYPECLIYDESTDCILKRGGYFASVTKSGTIKTMINES
jgi:MOSC domain-containing protein YiiM